MKNIKNNVLFAASVALAGAMLAPSIALAGSVDGKGGSPGGVPGGGGGVACNNRAEADKWSIDCYGYSWVYYKYVGGNDTAYLNQDFVYTPRFYDFGVNSYGLHYVLISRECAQDGRGFWHLGRNMGSHVDVWENTFGHPYVYNSTVYRNIIDTSLSRTSEAPYGKTGHRETYNYAGLPSYAKEETFDDSRLSHNLTAGGHVVYSATKYGKSADVEREYYNQVLHDGEPWKDVLSNEEKAEAKNEINTTIYFCAWEEVEPKTQEYEGKVNLKAKTSDNNVSTNPLIDITSDDNTVHEVDSPILYFNGYGTVTATNPNNPPNQADTKYTVTAKATANSTEIASTTSGEFSANGFSNGPSTVTSVVLAPGVEYTICATNNYYAYWDNKTSGGYSQPQSASACTKVKYDIECSEFNAMVGDHKNYGKLTVSIDGRSQVVGDIVQSDGSMRTDSTATLWARDSKDVDVRYYGCMGGQAAKVGKDGDTEYQTDSNLASDSGVNVFVGNSSFVGNNTPYGHNIGATELGLPNTTNGWKSLTSAVSYEFDGGDAYTNTGRTKVGSVYKDSLKWPRTPESTELVNTQITTNVPYNYVMKTKVDDLVSDLTIGNTISPSAEVSIGERRNAKVNGETYATSIKGVTKSIAWLFTLSADTTQAEIDALIRNKGASTLDGSYVYNSNETDLPINIFSGKTSNVERKDISGGFGTVTFDSKTISETEYIGSKVCIMAAAWPADSHNNLSGTGFEITDDSQSNALTHGAGTNPYWRFDFKCATVGKSPNISIEGGSLISSGQVKASQTTYNSSTFGSWAEYDIAARSARKIGSGASLAYATLPSVRNQAIDPVGQGLKTNDGIQNPQSLGNIGNSETTTTMDSSTYLQSAKVFADNLIAVADNSAKTGEETEFNFIGKPDQDMVIYSNGDIPGESSKINVVIGKNIKISNNVTSIKAIIIATEKLDTCLEADRNDSEKNESLLLNCKNPLIVDGAVYAYSVAFDRVYGGGSENDSQLDPLTLTQRAEIFSYDPRIIPLAYKYTQNHGAAEITGITEMQPRY